VSSIYFLIDLDIVSPSRCTFQNKDISFLKNLQIIVCVAIYH